ncbi:structure-specific endonuclease subunit SLX4 [Bombyx mandarina]|uniref:Structure-specific endonuclease subunit SLX4 n=1 Tax=Bombyx mandarina TaxID=7092 RepID=A0A6J2JPI9_BOMMA|nr:structure-specific endonuclease subunit SLX4 [Bombyx mandarina]
MCDSSNNSTKDKNVISKYFTRAADESLEDFKETKRIITSPKIIKPARKQRKNGKRICKQKDIRTSLKRKNNELIEFSKEFNNVCEKTGIDVDSEQLQLAVALSKSLQAEPSDVNPQNFRNSQERTKKIHATLQEYGFVVPETKITTSKKIKKNRKQYKLISLSDIEKQQNISEKYSCVLLEDIDRIDHKIESNISNSHLYNLSTNVSYEHIKDNHIFYVENLLEKSTSAFNLLRDWTEIPGRPVSPRIANNFISFSDIDCSQSELDDLLSGTFKRRTEIMVFKTNNAPKYSGDEEKRSNNKPEDNIVIESVTQHRCYSPDIFDDESSLMDNSRHAQLISQEKHISMDLTECLNHVSQITSKSAIMENKNITRRRSNDFMDMTECVSSLKTVVSKIDLTVDHINIILEENHTEDDLEKPSMPRNSKNNLDIDVIDADEYTRTLSNKRFETKEVLDLTQDKDISAKRECQSFFDDFIHDHDSKENVTIEVPFQDSEASNNIESRNLDNGNEEIDLTQSPELLNDTDDIDLKKAKNNTEHENYSKNHTLNDSIENENAEVFKEIVKDCEEEIDLTQSSNSPNGSDRESPNLCLSALGKMDNISIDYDEIQSGKHTVYSSNENSSKIDPIEIQDVELSQKSEIFEIHDNELDYSLNKSRFENSDKAKLTYLDKKVQNQESFESETADKQKDDVEFNDNEYTSAINLQNEVLSSNSVTPSREKNIFRTETPKNNDFIIKLDEVTPMQDYASMTSPERNRELYKYGLKPLKRKRAIQLLTHLYNQTHPLIEEMPADVIASPSKKRKRNSPKAISAKKDSPIKHNVNIEDCYEATNETPVIREVECHSDDWMFQKKERAKVHSCRLPLHIAFHNYVSCRSGLREAILKYEPVNIDVIHKELAGYGHRYDPKDLLKFLDKRCITVKTSDNAKSSRH